MRYLINCYYRTGDASYGMPNASRRVVVEAPDAPTARLVAIDAIYAFDPWASHVKPGTPIEVQ